MGPLLLIALAIWGRRRALIDPAIAERRTALKKERRRIQSSSDHPPAEATREIASALRAMVSILPAGRNEELDRFLQECETHVYAPQGHGPVGLGEDFHARAMELADRLITHDRSG